MNTMINNLSPETLLFWFGSKGVKMFLLIIIMFFSIKLSSRLAESIIVTLKGGKSNIDIEMQKRVDTLASLLQNLFNITIFIVIGLMVLNEFGIDIRPMIAAAGVAGIAIGFGAQKLVEDIISGYFIFFEDQIRVGDVIDIAGKGGLVEKVTLRMIVLRDLAGNVHYIRNGLIGVVTNMTKEYSRYVFDIRVAYKENIDEVIKVIKEVDKELREDVVFKYDILEEIEILGLDKFDSSAIIIKARTKTKPIKQWEIGREFNKRLKKRFDELGIEIPFPHLTLYAGIDKKGSAPSFNIKSAD